MTANRLPKPTPEQAAILRSKKQCKIVVAVPGAGKTTMLLQAIQQHYRNNHTECLFISFSRKSTAENVEKIQRYFPSHIHQITVSTFDSFCYRVLHENWELAGYAKEPYFDRSFDPKLFTQAYEAVASKTTNFISMETAESVIRTSIFKHYSIKKAITKESTVGLTDYLKALRSIKQRYIKLRKNNGAIHFSEQVSECSKLLRAQPELITDLVTK